MSVSRFCKLNKKKYKTAPLTRRQESDESDGAMNPVKDPTPVVGKGRRVCHNKFVMEERTSDQDDRLWFQSKLQIYTHAYVCKKFSTLISIVFIAGREKLRD